MKLSMVIQTVLVALLAACSSDGALSERTVDPATAPATAPAAAPAAAPATAQKGVHGAAADAGKAAVEARGSIADCKTSPDSSCTEQQTLDRYALLRRLSIDLRNRLPSIEEYAALDELEEVPESTIDAWIASDDFRLAMRRYHEKLLWPNPQGAQIVDINTRLVSSRLSTDSGTLTVYSVFSNGRRTIYRGTSSVVCGAWLQKNYNSDGTPVAVEVYDPANPTQLLYRQEGYVKVRPYWDPSTEINVCAYDAQTAAQGATYACNTIQGVRDSHCGCGPDLRWCFGPPVQNQLWVDMREQLGRAVDSVTTNGAPYTDLLTSTAIDMNGPLSFWKKHLAQMVSPNRTINAQGPGDPTLPEEPDYTDSTWVRYTRTDAHAGILTMPAYTLRFQTNRARANRLRIAFTGQYFVPSDQPEDPTTADCAPSSGDLTQQCTCRYCHQTLEPLAASFGKVVEAGSRLISDLAPYSTQCDPRNYGTGQMYPGQQSPPASCSRYYEITSDAQNPGWLLTHQYAYLESQGHNNEGLDDELHRSIYARYQEGPVGIAREIIDDGQLANATAKQLFHHLMGRELIVDTTDPNHELELLGELSASFRVDYQFPNLAKSMVMLPQYRRIR